MIKPVLEKKSMIGAGILSCLLFMFLSPVNAHAESCITAECHTEFKQLKKLHFPASDDCTRCHAKTGKHSFKLVEQRELCYECHDENRKRKYVHEALKSMECKYCHNSHGGNYKAYLTSERIDTMCFECHDKAPMTKKTVHQPLEDGKCTACHEPHSSDYPVLLTSKKEEFCIKCHEDQNFAANKKLKLHSILAEGCEQCHSPHSSDYKYMLSAAPGDICAGCHEDIGEKATSAPYKHRPLTEDRKCLNCHDAHASLFDAGLLKKQTELCIKCHNKWIKGSDGQEFNIYKMVSTFPVKHQPVTDGECHGCHDPHGSNFYKILNAAYPASFYAPFKEESYELCFQCHDAALATSERARKDTSFRDAKRNLHYVHINLEKGRACRACHEPHATKNHKLIRNTTPFGKWSLPVGFKKTPNGGSCAPGCHKPFTYDRTIKE